MNIVSRLVCWQQTQFQKSSHTFYNWSSWCGPLGIYCTTSVESRLLIIDSNKENEAWDSLTKVHVHENKLNVTGDIPAKFLNESIILLKLFDTNYVRIRLLLFLMQYPAATRFTFFGARCIQSQIRTWYFAKVNLFVPGCRPADSSHHQVLFLLFCPRWLSNCIMNNITAVIFNGLTPMALSSRCLAEIY